MADRPRRAAAGRARLAPTEASPQFRITQLHIDVTRNSTDDFNPFHDPARWHLIQGNPFAGPIALGFQLEALAVAEAERIRDSIDAGADEGEGPEFENLQFGFVNALLAGEAVEIQVRRGKGPAGDGGISNRLLMRKVDGGDLILMGTRKLAVNPSVELPAHWPAYERLAAQNDRQPTEDGSYFLKRKYLTTSNGKNFCVGSCIDQRRYFDELAERVHFPAMFVVALSSCALLEMAWDHGHDFMAEPLVYTGHHISIDRRVQRTLRSNQPVQLLVERVDLDAVLATGTNDGQVSFRCLGVVEPGAVLFGAELRLASLEIVKRADRGSSRRR